MPEERGLYPRMLVGEQVEYLGRLHGMSPTAAARGARKWLELLGIADRARSTVESLSQTSSASGSWGRSPAVAAVVADGPDIGTTVQLVPEASEQAAENDLRDGQIDMAVITGRQILVDKTITSGSTSTTAQLVRALSRTVGTGEARGCGFAKCCPARLDDQRTAER